MAKTITLNVLENSLTADLQQESEHNATVLTVDFTGCGVDGAVKWVDFIMSDGTQASTSLGTSIVPTYSLPNTLTKGGVLELQAYAKNGTSVTYKSKVFRVTIKRSLDVTTNTSDYDISVVESLQDAISDALIQVETIWEAYNTGELDGDDGLDGVSVNSIAFIGNDLVFTMSDSTIRTLVGAKLDLQGSKGDKGDNGDKGLDGKTIVSASFVGDDLVFINNDSSTVTLVNARLALKGNTGASGISAYQVAVNNGFVGTEAQWLLSLKGAEGDKGDTGSIDDLGGVIAGLTEKTTPVNADKFVISDSADTNNEKQLSWSNIKTTLKSYFDTLYNNYVHPANHAPSIITQNSSNRFVTDAEKTAWNAKQSALVSGTNIKSINGSSVLGSGDLAISSGIAKNWIINGMFDVWQRGTSQTTSGYGSDDRFSNAHTVSTKTNSRQAFTVGQTAVPNNPNYFCRTVVVSGGTAQSFVIKQQLIEDVTKLAGKTITLSFWAKADANKNMSIDFWQDFGVGGSTLVEGIGVQKFALTTSWQLFTKTITLPSVSGKTIGTDSFLKLRMWFDAGADYNIRTNSLGNQSGTFDIANVSLVEGSVAVECQNQPYADVLRDCQRYYQRLSAGDGGVAMFGYATTSTSAIFSKPTIVPLRKTPLFEYSSVILSDGTALYTMTNLVLWASGIYVVGAQATSSGMTAFRPLHLELPAGAYLAFNAEL